VKGSEKRRNLPPRAVIIQIEISIRSFSKIKSLSLESLRNVFNASGLKIAAVI
jgi:hypothetical protein